MKVVALSRYAIKGLGPDSLESVIIDRPGYTFPDDRRYALIKSKNREKFCPEKPEWIHKENFLCAFTAGELLATFDTRYADASNELTVWRRDGDASSDRPPLLGPVDLASAAGRDAAASFFSSACGEPVACVVAGGAEHVHQFGNTRSGVRERGDTRTVHIVNAETVRAVGDAIGVRLRPSRFRPNIVVEGLEAWKEFDAVGKTIAVHGEDGGTLKFDVISRTVRCDGIGVDPLEPSTPPLDMPKLIADKFPEHGPFLGVYAVVSEPGEIKIGDEMSFEL